MKSSIPFERVIALDFESTWDSKYYTLKQLTTEEYIRDKRFKAWGCSWQYLDDTTGHPQWVSGKDLPAFFAGINWTRTAALAHNAQFDIAILAWKYGHVPCFIFDSLSMARALYGVEAGNSLFALTERLGLPLKGKALNSTDGIMDALPAHVEAELAEYCNHDVSLCMAVFDRLSPGYPKKELRLIDLTLRMFVKPVLQLDRLMLVDAIKKEKVKREGLLAKLQIKDADLASNDKFAEVLRAMGVTPPMKISKLTEKPAYAFAKADALFQALINHDREDVALLCEARLAVKSTLERTRAQRFLDIAGRGALPVPLNYYGAHTGRWSASKGSGLNMQNLKRGSFLRDAVYAPDGYMLVVADLAQIEPRVLAWLADDRNMLRTFASGKDPYSTFGATMFGIPGLNKVEHPALRQSAKSALLGCFGPTTPVLTARGWVPIISVTRTDLVWDGAEWVKHQGVVAQGEKKVLTAHGISATMDHEILTAHGWRAWSAVLTDLSLFQSAQSLVSLPAEAGSDMPTRITHACGVPAAGKDVSIDTTFYEGHPHAAGSVPERKGSKPGGRKKGISLSARIMRIETGCLTALARSLYAVLIQKTRSIPIMEGAVSRCIRHGLQIAWSFFGISSRLMAGIYPRYSWIELTTTKGISPETYGFVPKAKTERISAHILRGQSKYSTGVSLFLKQKMQTYDIAYAGPQNRYTILTDAGPLIVHNCGYGLGWASFAGQLMAGFMGADPVIYGATFAKTLGMNAQDVVVFMDNPENVEKMHEIPRICSNDQLAVHCCVTQRIVDLYRSAAKPVLQYWRLNGDLIYKCLVSGSASIKFNAERSFKHKNLTYQLGEIVLPNGMSLRYPDIQGTSDAQGRTQWTYGAGKDRKKLYGGKITENIVQAVARVVMTDGMLRIQQRYPCVLTVHDEVVVLVPEQESEEAIKWINVAMTHSPKYLPGVPLSVTVGMGKRYGECKA